MEKKIYFPASFFLSVSRPPSEAGCKGTKFFLFRNARREVFLSFSLSVKPVLAASTLPPPAETGCKGKKLLPLCKQ
ncbi:hypothetical protein [Pontibacter diazotrophicus]|uniref:hypothetical protein n=1 Tax=Pontibacter diazotrophicus TaxID=1400979 RepID=UPI0011C02829|nr:hypothetical protein [Pontibacter diazotrophicus]